MLKQFGTCVLSALLVSFIMLSAVTVEAQEQAISVPPVPAPQAVAVQPAASVWAPRLVGKYLGWEGDDKIGFEITADKKNFAIIIYEDGLPGEGFNEKDDDYYKGTAELVGNELKISLTQKFDETREEKVDRELRELTATISEKEGKLVLTIPKNREWDKVEVTKK